MDARVWELGLERFDPNDVLSHPLFMAFGSGRGRYLAYPLRMWELHAPMLWRRFLRIRPALVPTTIFHLGMAHLHLGGIAGADVEDRLEQLCERALATRLPGDLAAWGHPYDAHGAVYRERGATPSAPDVPPSCAHHTGRLGMLLLRAGLSRGRSAWVAAARSAADALLRYHNWHDEEDGTSTVSYYPDTDDEVLNTAAEVALLLAAVGAGPDPHPEAADRATRLVRMLIREQREDGGWTYTTRRHDEAAGQASDTDNHHNAMILASLSELLSEGLLEAEEAAGVRAAVDRGLSYYLDTFCTPGGFSRELSGTDREAPVAGYAEGVRAMLAVLAALGSERDSATPRIEAQVVAGLRHALDRFYDPETGDVASFRLYGATYRIRSIRWGAGLLMEATAEALAWPRRLPLVARP
jgi:hypothetical protein